MRVLKVAKINKKHRFDCDGCKATLEVEDADMKYENDVRPGDEAYTFVCCACGRKNWVDPMAVRGNKS